MIQVLCDGSARPNPPNPRAMGYYGMVVQYQGNCVYRQAGYLGNKKFMTGVVAEILASLKSIQYIEGNLDFKDMDVSLVTDSAGAVAFLNENYVPKELSGMSMVLLEKLRDRVSYVIKAIDVYKTGRDYVEKCHDLAGNMYGALQYDAPGNWGCLAKADKVEITPQLLS